MLHRELTWLEDSLRPYRLIYLDSLICQPDFAKSGRLTFPWSRPKSGEAALIKAMVTSLKHETLDAARYLDDKGVGAKVKADRALQTRLSTAINDATHGVRRRYSSAAMLSTQRAPLEKIADRPFNESLIMVDAMLVARNRMPHKISATAAFADTTFSGERRVECALTDQAPDLLTLRDALIGVVVDSQSFYAWHDEFTQIISTEAGWYPFVRTIGLYSTSPGGRPLINALALLVRPCPTPDEFLSNRTVGGKVESFVRTFNRLQEEVKKLHDEASKRTAASSPAKPSTIAYHTYRDYLLPVQFFALLCRLNRLNAESLRRHSIAVYTALDNYLMSLQGLAEFLDAQGKALGRLPQAWRLLQEPEAWEGDELAPA